MRVDDESIVRVEPVPLPLLLDSGADVLMCSAAAVSWIWSSIIVVAASFDARLCQSSSG